MLNKLTLFSSILLSCTTISAKPHYHGEKFHNHVPQNGLVKYHNHGNGEYGSNKPYKLFNFDKMAAHCVERVKVPGYANAYNLSNICNYEISVRVFDEKYIKPSSLRKNYPFKGVESIDGGGLLFIPALAKNYAVSHKNYIACKKDGKYDYVPSFIKFFEGQWTCTTTYKE